MRLHGSGSENGDSEGEYSCTDPAPIVRRLRLADKVSSWHIPEETLWSTHEAMSGPSSYLLFVALDVKRVSRMASTSGLSSSKWLN
jgi:hypothetical protein